MMAVSGDRPVATLSLDLDDTWAYLRTRGEADWADAPTVLPLVIDRLLPLLDELQLRITVFVVGRDAERPEGRGVIREIAAAGHEIANHSWMHRAELSQLPADAIAEDLERAAVAIGAATERAPRGFRCPSFGTSPALLTTLVEAGYAYDASVLPTSLGPLLRVYYRARMRTGAATAGAFGPTSAQLFGPTANALLPLTPFRWRTPSGPLLELPVSSVPFLRTPFHMSYLQALGAHSPRLADGYLRLALGALARRGVPPSFLLHPTDFIDADDAPAMAYFPGMARPWADKLAQLRRALDALIRRTRVGPLGEHAEELCETELPVRSPAQPPSRRPGL